MLDAERTLTHETDLHAGLSSFITGLLVFMPHPSFMSVYGVQAALLIHVGLLVFKPRSSFMWSPGVQAALRFSRIIKAAAVLEAGT